MNKAEISWFEKELIPKILKSFGNNVELVRYNLTTPKDFICISRIYFLDLTYRYGEKYKKTSMVVKRPPKYKRVQELVQIDILFHNEILFYNRIAKNSEDYPRCIYTVEQPVDDAVIVMENVTIEHGYNLCQDKYSMPTRYALVAVQELGRFHAKGYVMKEHQPEEFFKIIRDIRDPRYEKSESHDFGIHLNMLINRQLKLIRPLIKDDNFYNAVETLLQDAFGNVLMKCVNPKEPLAVMCHGDYTRNNVLFKEVNGTLRARLIDFAMIKYSSPAIDLSTFVFISCTSEFRRNNFFIIFKAYYDALCGYLKENGVENVEKYSYEAFREDYEQNEFFGALIADFFLPVLRMKDPPSLEEMIMKDTNEAVNFVIDYDTEYMGQLFVDLLMELKDSGCLRHFLK